MVATIILSIALLAALFFAVRHIVNNFREGREDCCPGSGSGGCGCCSHCGASTKAK